MTAILGLLRGFWKYIAIFAAGAAALFLYGRSERKKGAAEKSAEQSEKVLEDVKKANEAMLDLDDPDVRDKLRRFDRKY